MPVYEYRCAACEHEFEEWQKMSDAPVKTCPKCKKRRVERLISATSFSLKGGGWYKDLYSSSKAPGSGESKSEGSSSKSEGKGDGGEKGSSEKSGDKSDKSSDAPSEKKKPKKKAAAA